MWAAYISVNSYGQAVFSCFTIYCLLVLGSTGHCMYSFVYDLYNVQWDLSKMVDELGSHLSKAASLPGPK